MFATAADASTAERQAQHAAARLHTKHYCDIATLAWEAQLEGLVREACPSALALDWSPEVDPEVVRWQAEVHTHAHTHTLDLGNFPRINASLLQNAACTSCRWLAPTPALAERLNSWGQVCGANSLEAASRLSVGLPRSLQAPIRLPAAQSATWGLHILLGSQGFPKGTQQAS